MSAIEETTNNVFGATLTRRKFVKGSGAMIVGFSLVGAGLGAKKAKVNGYAFFVVGEGIDKAQAGKAH